MTALASAARRHARRRPIDAIWLGVLLYSTGPVMVAASTLDGPDFSLLRLAIGVPVLWLLARRNTKQAMGDQHRAAWLTLLAGVSFGGHQLALMTALKWTSVADVVLMNTLAPVVVTMLAIPLFAERPGINFRGWGLLAIVGAGIVAWGGSTGPSGNIFGMVLAVFNVVAFSIFFLCSKAARSHIDVWRFLAWTITIAAAFVLAFVSATGGLWPHPTRLDWVLATTLAIGPGAVGHFLMTWPLRWIPANLPPVLRLAQPCLSGGLAWLILGQALTMDHLLGGTITIVGVGGAISAWSGDPVSAGVKE